MKELPRNEQIRATVILLIAEDGTRRQFMRAAATQMARDKSMDLVQVAPGNPPVCKILDYGKLKYDRSKNEKKNQHSQAQQKEMWFKLKTAEHDLERKLSQVSDWLRRDAKVLLGIELEGREKYSDVQRRLAREMIDSLIARLGDACVPAKLSEGGKETSVMVAPKKS